MHVHLDIVEKGHVQAADHIDETGYGVRRPQIVIVVVERAHQGHAVFFILRPWKGDRKGAVEDLGEVRGIGRHPEREITLAGIARGRRVERHG